MSFGIESNNKSNKTSVVGGTATLGLGGYAGYKAITSGARRMLGVRIEEHTTSKRNAQNIIKDGKILDPKYGGKGSAQFAKHYKKNSENFVHITGYHDNHRKYLKELVEMLDDFLNERGIKNFSQKVKKLSNTPALDCVRVILRKMQRLMYRTTSALNAKGNLNGKTSIIKTISSKENIITAITAALTGKGTKTFYIGGSDSYFNANFIPDEDDIALKSSKPIKVSKTKIGATIEALKREGLKGIKQNKTRVFGGVAILATLGTISYKLIKTGLAKLGVIDKNSSK